MVADLIIDELVIITILYIKPDAEEPKFCFFGFHLENSPFTNNILRNGISGNTGCRERLCEQFFGLSMCARVTTVISARVVNAHTNAESIETNLRRDRRALWR
jgi:hypothetical protein